MLQQAKVCCLYSYSIAWLVELLDSTNIRPSLLWLCNGHCSQTPAVLGFVIHEPTNSHTNGANEAKLVGMRQWTHGAALTTIISDPGVSSAAALTSTRFEKTHHSV